MTWKVNCKFSNSQNSWIFLLELVDMGFTGLHSKSCIFSFLFPILVCAAIKMASHTSKIHPYPWKRDVIQPAAMNVVSLQENMRKNEECAGLEICSGLFGQETACSNQLYLLRAYRNREKTLSLQFPLTCKCLIVSARG